MFRQLRAHRMLIAIVSFATVTAGVVAAPAAVAEPRCAKGGPPHSAATLAVDKVYGQPATLWITADERVGITTNDGTSSLPVPTTSPIVQQALLVDAQQDGSHQIIVDTGRQADLFTAVGCTLTIVVDDKGGAFQFDLGHRLGWGDGYGCGDLGDGPHLISVLNLREQAGMMRRTQIDLSGNTATLGRSDVVPTYTDTDCGGRNMERNGVRAPNGDN